MKDFFSKEEKKVQVIENEAGYLVHLKFDAFGYSLEDLQVRFAKYQVLPMYMNEFYYPYIGKPEVRLNIGCPRFVLMRAL